MMSNKKLSILFTGQGSQNPEMGSDLANKFDWIKNRYEISSDILGYDVFQAQRNPKLINLTEYSQPMIFIFSSILIDIYRHTTSRKNSNSLRYNFFFCNRVNNFCYLNIPIYKV